jgi:alkylation response protein AidB-like acyl-CoA dehydrogenase
MDFFLTDTQLEWRATAETIARGLPAEADAAAVVRAAARGHLIGAGMDLLSASVAVEAMAGESAAAALAYALHAAVVMGAAGPRPEALERGEAVGAVALSSEAVPVLRRGRLSGRASWVAPLTSGGIAVVGAHDGDGAVGGPVACLVPLDAPGVSFEAVETAALRGLVCGHVMLEDVGCTASGPTAPFMARIRVLLAAAGLGMGRRAVRESMAAARALNRTGAGGEQTVQGLLADAATEIDAAKLLTWRAASAPALSLAAASMAKLAATEATQRAVARATQVVGAESFRQGHAIERLAQDVRALELFAGRTEALRESVAAETCPTPP